MTMSTTLDFPLRGAELVRKRPNTVRISDEELERLGIIDTAQRTVYRAISAESFKLEGKICRSTGLSELVVRNALSALMGANHIRRAASSPLTGVGAFEIIGTRPPSTSTAFF